MNRKFLAVLGSLLVGASCFAQGVIPTGTTVVASSSLDLNGVTHYSTATVSIVQVGTGTVQLVAANPQRVYLRVIQPTGASFYLAPTQAGTLSATVYQDTIASPGGSLTYPNLSIDGTTPTCAFSSMITTTTTLKASVIVIEGSK